MYQKAVIRNDKICNDKNYVEIFKCTTKAMQIAEALGNDEVYEILREAGSKIAKIHHAELERGKNNNDKL